MQQSEMLLGVRFGKQTRYCLLDIDITSAYHPQRDTFAISNLVAALEPLGLVSYVACTSSYSNGIHLYFPFQHPQNSWEVATAVAAALEKAGFKLAPGQLEIFPNPRTYVAGSHPSLFHAHRLPIQVGSYLLNQDFQAVWSDRATFVQRWQFAQSCNQLNSRLLKQLVQTRQKARPVSVKAEKFLADLNTEISAGWTGSGQTNRLLGRIAMRTYVFHHVLFDGEPLTGEALVGEIVAVARSLPGYQFWCQHQHEIESRSTEWARSVEGSHYFPYGSRRSVVEIATDVQVASLGSELSWNQQQSDSARERIKQALAQLLETNTLPVATTARFRALTQFGIGGSSLYRHRDLWHPHHLVENPPDPPALKNYESACAEGASDSCNSSSLFPVTGSNPFQSQASVRSIDPNLAPGRNSLAFPFIPHLPLSPEQRMQQFLDSGDPILVAEALLYFQSQQVCAQPSGKPQGEISPVQELQDWEGSQFFTQCDLDGRLRSVVSPSENLPEDVSDVLATITIQIRRLGWTKNQVMCHLRQRFGKAHQSRLDNRELVEWLEWLKAYGFPADTG